MSNLVKRNLDLPKFALKANLKLQINKTNIHTKLNYVFIKEQALSHSHTLLKTWLPNGVVKAHEYIALNPTRHDRNLGSFRINMRSGIWADFATQDRGGDLISLLAYLDHSSNSQAARKISAFLGLEETHHVG